jgi:hypothetical protein
MKPFLSGRPQHTEPSLSQEAGQAAAAGFARLHKARSHAAEHAVPAAGASVECIKQGDKIVRLVVTCSCGERIEIDCLYPNGG